MAQISFPNQDKVTIHKERYDANFLQVGIDEWIAATTKNTLRDQGVLFCFSSNKKCVIISSDSNTQNGKEEEKCGM